MMQRQDLAPFHDQLRMPGSMILAERIAAVPWHEYEQPDGNEPGDVAEALLAIWKATDKKSSSDANNRFLYAVGNNHAGTYCPVVLVTLPFLAEILETGGAWAQTTVLEVLGDLYGSFRPEGLGSEAAQLLEDRLRRGVRAFRDTIEAVAAAGGVNSKAASSIVELLD